MVSKYDPAGFGDTSTLADPTVVDKLIKLRIALSEED